MKTYDQLKILPSGKNILVKSIQMHDDPVNESKSPARVGLAIKGVDANDISRGDILCSHTSSNLRVKTDTIPAEFMMSLSQRRSYREPNLLIIRWNANQAGKDKTY